MALYGCCIGNCYFGFLSYHQGQDQTRAQCSRKLIRKLQTSHSIKTDRIDDCHRCISRHCYFQQNHPTENLALHRPPIKTRLQRQVKPLICNKVRNRNIFHNRTHDTDSRSNRVPKLLHSSLGSHRRTKPHVLCCCSPHSSDTLDTPL